MTTDRQKSTATTARCWCGGEELRHLNQQYAECASCGTAVLTAGRPAALRPGGDPAAFYAERYWRGHQQEELGLPDLARRAREDLPGRCQYWLGWLLRFRPPPANVLEVGCGHGGLVACCRQAGYGALGLEPAEWVADFARRAFGVQVRCGTPESLDFEPEAFDVIAMMDVLEHLPDPAGAIAALADVLAPDGLLVVQTPCYGPDRPAGWPHFNAPEHLHLFTENSLRDLLAGAGLGEVEFCPPLFGHGYDMFCFAGRQRPAPSDPERVEQALLSSPGGRLALAMQDLYWGEAPPWRAGVRAAAWQLMDAVKRRLRRGRADDQTRKEP